MSFSIKKAVIKGRTMTVVNQNEFENMDDSSKEGVCVEINGYLYPYYKTIKDEPSCTKDDFAIYYITPKTEEEKKEYSTEKIKDFSDIGNFKDYLENVYEMQKDQKNSLMSINKDYFIPIYEQDNPEVKLIKQAINAKHIDNDVYKAKFSSASDFNNDNRSLNDPNNHNISFYKLVRDCEAYDIDAILILKDKPNVANPMGQVFTTYLTNHSEIGAEPDPEETPSKNDTEKNDEEEEIEYDENEYLEED